VRKQIELFSLFGKSITKPAFLFFSEILELRPGESSGKSAGGASQGPFPHPFCFPAHNG